MRKFGLGITLGALFVVILNFLTGKDLFVCGFFIMICGIVLTTVSKS